MSRMGGFIRGIKGSVIGSAVLLAWEGWMMGTCLMAWFVCPLWFLLSLLKNAVERPGWGIALVRIAIPALTLGLLWANNAIQLGVAEANSRRIIAACEDYHAANSTFPVKLDELVPRYMNHIPPAKYCLDGKFKYHNFGTPMLYWHVVPPFYRKIYNFETRSWSYLD